MSGPLSPCGQGISLSAFISSGIGMPIGIGIVAIGTHVDCGLASDPPRKPSVIPFGVWHGLNGLVDGSLLQPAFDAGESGAGSMSPPAARRMSRPPVVPGEMLASAEPRSMCPSRPSSIGTHVAGSAT